MPIWADPARGERVRLLADDDLTLLAMFVAPPSARPTASDLRALPGTDLARFAEVAMRDLPGVQVTAGLDEAAALTAAGAVVGRSLVHMVRQDLQDDSPPLRWAAPHLAAGLSVVGVESVNDDTLEAAQRLAYGSAPDHGPFIGAHEPGLFSSLLAGELLGPVYQDASIAVLDAGGGVVGGLIATRWEGIGSEWRGGPWVAEVFTIPGAPLLLGRSLLARAVAVSALDGHRAVGLTMSATNRARHLHERLGFRDAFYRVTLDLPGTWPGGPEGQRG